MIGMSQEMPIIARKRDELLLIFVRYATERLYGHVVWTKSCKPLGQAAVGSELWAVVA
jgi:hypothetical protein